jgi:hypothetical protein
LSLEIRFCGRHVTSSLKRARGRLTALQLPHASDQDRGGASSPFLAEPGRTVSTRPRQAAWIASERDEKPLIRARIAYFLRWFGGEVERASRVTTMGEDKGTLAGWERWSVAESERLSAGAVSSFPEMNAWMSVALPRISIRMDADLAGRWVGNGISPLS